MASVIDTLDSLAAVLSPQGREIPPQTAHSSGMEEVILVYCVGTGRFSPDKKYINLQMDMYDFHGKWVGYQLGVHLSNSTPEDLLSVPRPPEGSFTDPNSPVPTQVVKEWTKGVWTFADGSAIYAVGPAQSHIVPFKDGSALFMVTTAQTITRGTGVYEHCAGTKQATGTAFIPASLWTSGQFPAGVEIFPAKTIETFRLIKQPFMGPPPGQAPSAAQTQPGGGSRRRERLEQ